MATKWLAEVLTEHAALSLSVGEDRIALASAIELRLTKELEQLGRDHPDHHSGSAIFCVVGDLLDGEEVQEAPALGLQGRGLDGKLLPPVPFTSDTPAPPAADDKGTAMDGDAKREPG